eukprot:1015005-Pelagomonas_calceolata.AAC.2
MNVAAWECPARLVGHAHSPLHAPAVAVRLGQLDSDIALLPKVTLLPHLRHQPGQRITHAVRIQRLLTLGIVVDRPDVAARLAEGPTNCATLLLLLRCGFLLLRGCLICSVPVGLLSLLLCTGGPILENSLEAHCVCSSKSRLLYDHQQQSCTPTHQPLLPSHAGCLG